MMYRYSIEINTRPFPKERPRLCGNRLVYTPIKTRNFENMIAFEWEKNIKT